MSGHSISQDLRQRQTQQLVLAPQLRQSLKILQVAALDLRSVIQQELQNNPTLEEMPSDDASFEKETGTDNHEAGDAAETREEMDFSKEFEILSKLDDDWRDHMAQVGGTQPYTNEDAEKRQHFFDSLVTETSLQEHLMRQAALADIDPPM